MAFRGRKESLRFHKLQFSCCPYERRSRRVLTQLESLDIRSQNLGYDLRVTTEQIPLNTGPHRLVQGIANVHTTSAGNRMNFDP
jgi:hypothetical protein